MPLILFSAIFSRSVDRLPGIFTYLGHYKQREAVPPQFFSLT